jgi:hypothetical protein
LRDAFFLAKMQTLSNGSIIWVAVDSVLLLGLIAFCCIIIPPTNLKFFPIAWYSILIVANAILALGVVYKVRRRKRWKENAASNLYTFQIPILLIAWQLLAVLNIMFHWALVVLFSAAATVGTTIVSLFCPAADNIVFFSEAISAFFVAVTGVSARDVTATISNTDCRSDVENTVTEANVKATNVSPMKLTEDAVNAAEVSGNATEVNYGKWIDMTFFASSTTEASVTDSGGSNWKCGYFETDLVKFSLYCVIALLACFVLANVNLYWFVVVDSFRKKVTTIYPTQTYAVVEQQGRDSPT